MSKKRKSISVATRVLIVAALIAVVAVGAYLNTTLNRSTTTSTTSTSETLSTISCRESTESGTASSSAFLQTPAVYKSLGYPKIYTGPFYAPYTASEPNFTVSYQENSTNFQLGYLVNSSVLDLNQAVSLATSCANVDPSNFTLSSAIFSQGSVTNATLTTDPSWGLSFAKIFGNYWYFGEFGTDYSCLTANVDALTGSVSSVQFDNSCSVSPPQGYQLKVNSTQALQAVRSANLTGVPQDLLRNGTVTSLDLRVLLLGPSSQNFFFQKPYKASLSGQFRLCWVVSLYSPVPQYGYQGTFAVDAEDGQLDAGGVQNMFPSTLFEHVSGSANYSSASGGLSVANESLKVSNSIVGGSGVSYLSVPNVIVIKPGSQGALDLNFSSNIPKNLTATLKVQNPFPEFQQLGTNALPSGMSVAFGNQPFVIPANRTAQTEIVFSTLSDATQGTYLLEINVALAAGSQNYGSSQVLILVSVWNGSGQWQAPPHY